MWDFFASDVGKVALGGLIAFAGQLVASLLAWFKEARFAASKKRKDAEYLAMRLVLVFDDLVTDCYKAVYDPCPTDQEGITQSSVADPNLVLPSDGDYKALPRQLMYQVLSMQNRLDGIKEGLSSVGEDSFPPDYEEYYEYREEHLSKLGLRALELIDELCRQYRIPLPEWPEFYNPKQSLRDRIAVIEKNQHERRERNSAMIASMTKS